MRTSFPPPSDGRYRRVVRVTLEMVEARGPDQRGGDQPTFEALASDGPDQFFLVYRDRAGESVRMQLTPASYPDPPED